MALCVQFSMGQKIWAPVAEHLVEHANRKVLTFDLFGRGFSDAAFPNDLALFTGGSMCSF
jgi:hypothetical protein